ncbi:hypothetical protein ACIA5H_14230 [Nocardia sp. NPDC051900]|uniref:hypothetical protein n=1 Tax=Nocardia sp. NPDC051900 TaxID=3364326 RepID=UPI0037A5E116
MTPWLPLISSLVIASVTLVGVRINNRTNRAAIAAADEREYRKWQRETVLRQCAEATETALLAHDEYHNLYLLGIKAGRGEVSAAAGELVAATDEYIRKLGANIAVLNMLNARKTAEQCKEMQSIVIDMYYTARNLAEDSSRGKLWGELDGYLDTMAKLPEQFAQVANTEMHRLGQSDPGQRINPIRARFRRALRADE